MSKNRIKVKDSDFKNKLDRKQSNKKQRRKSEVIIAYELEYLKAFNKALLDNFAR